MTPKINVSDLPDFDMAEHLKSDEDVDTYLTSVLEENDPAELTHALGVIARARGMTEVARASGLTRDDAELWSFSAQWQKTWGRKELRCGYVAVQNDAPAAYILTVCKYIPENCDAVVTPKIAGDDDIPHFLRKQAD